MLQHRAEFDAAVTFRNGGGLQAQRFRVDVPHGDVTEAEIAALFVAACGLLMVDRVQLSGIRIFAEPHKGTRGGPSDATAGPPRAAGRTTFVELNHVVSAGMTTYPGLPGPEISEHLTRADSRTRYAEG
ncbi:MAG TPA: cyclase family protein, partial [Actinoplanes sp.]|nr:cyclase family protein [Actinoplanes sp.]